MEKKKFKFEMPSTCALLFMLTIFAAILTWVIPAGGRTAAGGEKKGKRSAGRTGRVRTGPGSGEAHGGAYVR